MRHLLALLTIFTFLTSSTLHAQVPSYVPTDGLVGWWPFNGNANDESGNGNNGVVNGATLTTDRFGNSNSAYDYDGINDYIVVNNSPSLNPVQHSISCWVYSEGYYLNGQDDANYVVGKGLDFNPGNYSIHYKTNSLKARASLGNSGNNIFIDSNTPINQANWYHLASSWDGSNLKIYVNGFLETILTDQSNGQGTNGDNLYFGTMGANPQFPYWVNGLIDDIGIWSRALTPAEIQALYTGQGSSPCVSPTAVSFTGLATSYTTSAGPVTLAGTPADGVFIGPGITGSTFSPAVAGEGTHSISYTYLDGDNCVNTASLCTSVSLGMGLEPGGNAPGGVRVFPNPNRGQFTVELELAGLVGLQVFAARGALMHNEVFTASGSRTQRTLDLSAFAKGSYTLLVEHDGQRVSQTVVVE